ncbi:hypothetical protein SAY86_011727 [Trapa natans]|uniref:Uncharacterized protein n=1 Tax=Trapa natans TaxID=22666 RepID=A0AAN7R0W6_TRANT|nr:hypothetical protein SAY86_011727 [Trapa natans]
MEGETAREATVESERGGWGHSHSNVAEEGTRKEAEYYINYYMLLEEKEEVAQKLMDGYNNAVERADKGLTTEEEGSTASLPKSVQVGGSLVYRLERRKTLNIALELLTPRNVDEVVIKLKKLDILEHKQERNTEEIKGAHIKATEFIGLRTCLATRKEITEMPLRSGIQ